MQPQIINVNVLPSNNIIMIFAVFRVCNNGGLLLTTVHVELQFLANHAAHTMISYAC